VRVTVIEAVSVDIAISVLLASRTGYIKEDDAVRVVGLLRGLGLPVWHPLLSDELYREALSRSVEHRDGLKLPTPSPLGSCVFVTDEAELSTADIRWSMIRARELAQR
jgi:3-dehydroquinate synthetase